MSDFAVREICCIRVSQFVFVTFVYYSFSTSVCPLYRFSDYDYGSVWLCRMFLHDYPMSDSLLYHHHHQ